jgi:hypothetical protein
MNFLKKYSMVFFISLLIGLNLYGNEEISNENGEQRSSVSESTQESMSSRWHKRCLYLFGALNGFYLPLSYAVALGLDAFDLSNPEVKKTFEPFTKGVTLGIGCWFAYAILEWYLQLAVLKTINSVLQNPMVSKLIAQNNLMVQATTSAAS